MFQIVIHGDIFIDGQHYTVPQFFGPSLAGYGVVTGTYSYLAVSTTFTRQEGILKRLRGTPLPAWVYIAGRIGSALVIAALTSGLLLAITVVFYDLHIARGRDPGDRGDVHRRCGRVRCARPRDRGVRTER